MVAKSKNWDEYWEFFTTQAKNNTFFPDEYNLMNVQEKNGCLTFVTLKFKRH